MSTELHGSGVAASCATGLLTSYAEHLADEGCTETARYVESVRDEFSAEFLELRAQRDHARDVAAQCEAEYAKLRSWIK